MIIDPSISVGAIINLVVSLGAIAIASWRIVARLGRMEMKLNLLWKWFVKEHDIEDSDDK